MTAKNKTLDSRPAGSSVSTPRVFPKEKVLSLVLVWFLRSLPPEMGAGMSKQRGDGFVVRPRRCSQRLHDEAARRNRPVMR